MLGSLRFMHLATNNFEIEMIHRKQVMKTLRMHQPAHDPRSFTIISSIIASIFLIHCNAQQTNKTMIRIEVNDLSIAYRQTGDGPALVLLHGFVADSRYWEPKSMSCQGTLLL